MNWITNSLAAEAIAAVKFSWGTRTDRSSDQSSTVTSLAEVLAYQVSSLLAIAELLTPFLPDTASKIKAIFESGKVEPREGTLFPKHEEATTTTT